MWFGRVSATTADTFSTSELPQVIRDRKFLAFHCGMCFACSLSTSKLSKMLRRWYVFTCFYHLNFKLCFAPRRAGFDLLYDQMATRLPLQQAYLATLRSHKTEKTQCFATFLPFRSFSRTLIFFLLSLSLHVLFSDSSQLCVFHSRKSDFYINFFRSSSQRTKHIAAISACTQVQVQVQVKQ